GENDVYPDRASGGRNCREDVEPLHAVRGIIRLAERGDTVDEEQDAWLVLASGQPPIVGDRSGLGLLVATSPLGDESAKPVEQLGDSLVILARDDAADMRKHL